MPTLRQFAQGLGFIALFYVLLCGVALCLPASGQTVPRMEPGPNRWEADLPDDPDGLDLADAYWTDLP
jgi:hypothetical protein